MAMRNYVSLTLFHLVFAIAAVHCNNETFASKPTIVPTKHFEVYADVAVLKEAMKGMGTDETKISNILTKRGINQRLEITRAFKEQQKEELMMELDSEFVMRGNFKYVISSLLTPTLPQYYAKELHDAHADGKFDENVIVEILCILSGEGIRMVNKEYEKLFGHSLESHLAKYNGSDFYKRFLLARLHFRRDKSTLFSEEVAKTDAHVLLAEASGQTIQWGSEQSQFFKIFLTRSYAQLHRTLEVFWSENGKVDIYTMIRDNSKLPNNILAKALTAIVQCATSKIPFLAMELWNSLNSSPVNKRTITRIIVGRSEIDLADINEFFHYQFKQFIQDKLAEVASGSDEYALRSLLIGNACTSSNAECEK